MSMHHWRECTLLTVLAALTASLCGAQGERERRDHHEPQRGYLLDQRYHHDRYYPPRGFVVHELPHGYVSIHNTRGEFFFSQGIWYRRSGPDFLVIAPPIGLTLAVLPLGYTTLWVRGFPYYYANDVYYQAGPGGYVVVDPPNEAEVMTAPPPPGPAAGYAPPPYPGAPQYGGAPAPAPAPRGADDFFIYPKNQQTAEQQSADRYECHRWSFSQTGFDPTRPDGGVPPTQAAQQRTDYRRAMEACLTARGYTVK